MRALSLLCFVAIVVCGRLCIVFYAGSPIPFHDQWYAEAQGVLLPSFHHGLTVGHFFAPHGDHVIAPTRLLALLLVAAEGKWDCLSQMVVNAVISACCLWPLLLWAARRDPRGLTTALLCLLVGVSYGSPLFYGNVVWGFQSQILLMIAFSLGHLYLILVRPRGGWRWALGMLSGGLAAVSFASGYFAVIVVVVALWSGRKALGVSWRYVAWTTVGGAAIVGMALWLSPAHSGMTAVNLGNVLHTLVHALSFPERLFSYWGMVFWIPAVLALVLAFRRPESRLAWMFPLAAAAWCVLQAIAISAGRSEPVLALAPRYYDILMVGVVANACLLIELVKYSWERRASRAAAWALLAVWLVTVGTALTSFIRVQTVGDVPALVTQATGQVELISRYYSEQQNRDLLRATPFPIRTLPDAEFLGDMLDRSEIKALWPDSIARWAVTNELRELPWLGAIPRETWFRSCLLVLVAAVVTLSVIVLGFLFEWRTASVDEAIAVSSGRRAG